MTYINKKFFFPAVFGAMVLFFALGGIYFVYQYNHIQSTTSTRSATGETDAKATIAMVSKLMELPAEAPTLATVSDITKLHKQLFFRNGRNGDKVLIYQKAALAILYRPDTNKIINVGPLTIIAPTGEASPSADIHKVESP